MPSFSNFVIAATASESVAFCPSPETSTGAAAVTVNARAHATNDFILSILPQPTMSRDIAHQPDRWPHGSDPCGKGLQRPAKADQPCIPVVATTVAATGPHHSSLLHTAPRAGAVESAAEHTYMLHHAPDTEARDRSVQDRPAGGSQLIRRLATPDAGSLHTRKHKQVVALEGLAAQVLSALPCWTSPARAL